ncbi:hemolysin-III related-domain-containing protein [Phialemonium atrogriseum]|uniref:Hemolysin-III related-domain-containing protein n=1 Tax=Phialemonium atrogriseum TaxID=1093897 RepID=A0AAJ0BW08_9PEZI|nr:hemolysin-III related-domain-containing protein [Phialemonium atrogriseum]KAK1764134.1 hemolysin-III related-domain-containing protein [Phialemonium atrogriseum]
MAKDATASPSTLSPSKPSSTGFESVTSPILDPRDRHETDSYWPVFETKDQIPAWLRDNDYIMGSHPMPTYSYRRLWRLWRCLHMETMNIWTHLLGAAAFLTAGVTLYKYTSASGAFRLAAGDKFAFGGFLTSATLCFGLSTAFHTLRSHSYNTHHFWGKMDILGICVLALGAGTSMTYYAFYCRPVVQRVYWSLNLCSALAAAFTLFDTGGGGSKMRTLRGGVFGLLTLSAMLPLFHGAGEMGWALACEEIGAAWYLAEGLSLLVGVCLFVGRIPERFRPGLVRHLGSFAPAFPRVCCAWWGFPCLRWRPGTAIAKRFLSADGLTIELSLVSSANP